MGRILSYVGWPLVVASGYGILHWMANRAVFYPAPYPQGPWNLSVELGVTDVWLLTSDGVRLQGWWKAPADARLATVFFHGNAGNLSYRGEHLREITAAGSAVLMVDYRGYGKSAGTPTEKGLYADADAAYENVLARGYRPEQIVIHGESLGTAVAVDLAARRGCAGLVLEAPFTSGRRGRSSCGGRWRARRERTGSGWRRAWPTSNRRPRPPAASASSWTRRRPSW